MGTSTRILLDMDGVLSDFVTAISAVHHRPSPYLDPANWGTWEMEKIWGISVDDFYSPTDNIEFWANMPCMPYGSHLVDDLVDTYGEDNIAICTAPTQSQYCIPGKRQWMKRHYAQYPDLARRMIFTKEKWFLSAPGMVLYDDRDKNVEDFVSRGAGGGAVLVPQLWNRRYAEVSPYVTSA